MNSSVCLVTERISLTHDVFVLGHSIETELIALLRLHILMKVKQIAKLKKNNQNNDVIRAILDRAILDRAILSFQVFTDEKICSACSNRAYKTVFKTDVHTQNSIEKI